MGVAPKIFPQRGQNFWGCLFGTPSRSNLGNQGRPASAIVLVLGRDMLKNVQGIVALTVLGQGRKNLATMTFSLNVGRLAPPLRQWGQGR